MSKYLFLFSLVALLGACSPEAKAPQEANTVDKNLVSVQVEAVVPASEVSPIISSGRVASKEEIKLSFKIGGVIEQIRVDEGDRVRKGQLLAKLDPAEISAQVSQANSATDKAKRDLARAERLYKDTVITLEQLENLRTALEVAEADLQIASFNQSRSAIYAQSSGTILRRMAEAGELTNPGAPILVMAANQSAQIIRIGLSDVDVVKIKLGDKAKVFFDAWPGETFNAKVSEIAASADPASGTFEVELNIEKSNKQVKNGFVGKVQLLPASQAEYLKIPMAAIVEADQDHAIVYVPDTSSEKAIRMALSPYEISNDALLIPASRYGSIEQVITEGAKYIKADSRIAIVAKPKGGMQAQSE